MVHLLHSFVLSFLIFHVRLFKYSLSTTFKFLFPWHTQLSLPGNKVNRSLPLNTAISSFKQIFILCNRPHTIYYHLLILQCLYFLSLINILKYYSKLHYIYLVALIFSCSSPFFVFKPIFNKYRHLDPLRNHTVSVCICFAAW